MSLFKSVPLLIIASSIVTLFAFAKTEKITPFDNTKLYTHLQSLSHEKLAAENTSEFFKKNYQLNCNPSQVTPLTYESLRFITEFEILKIGPPSDEENSSADMAQQILNIMNLSSESVQQVQAALKIVDQILAPYLKNLDMNRLPLLVQRNHNEFVTAAMDLCRQNQCENDYLLEMIFTSIENLPQGNIRCLNLTENIFLKYYVDWSYELISHPEKYSKSLTPYLDRIRKEIIKILPKFNIYRGTVYVGSHFSKKDLETLSIGQPLEYNGFLSSSFDDSFKNFVVNTVLVIKNKSGRNIAPFNTGESEVLFVNPKFIIRDKKIDQAGTVWFFVDEQ